MVNGDRRAPDTRIQRLESNVGTVLGQTGARMSVWPMTAPDTDLSILSTSTFK